MKSNVSLSLLPEYLQARFKVVGNQIASINPVILAHYYSPRLGLSWYAASYFPGSKSFFGWQSGSDFSLGIFTLDELLETMAYRDLSWTEKHLSEVTEYVTG